MAEDNDIWRQYENDAYASKQIIYKSDFPYIKALAPGLLLNARGELGELRLVPHRYCSVYLKRSDLRLQ